MFYIAKNIFGKTDNRATQQFMWKRLIRVIPLWWFYVTIPLLIGMKIIILINLPAYLNNNLIVVLLIAACIISGIILFHLIEKPLQKWLTKVFDNKWKSKNKRLALANEGRTEKA